ncbi:hypothetical protein PR048_005408 [Dryococelus australis]|uniref:Integrase zinc-binding domain-containing protein n=1 Tax=Dryococelus australis TaxID=614101 RepID=A0ABQ9I845_9NEOP|nr:hypothetical protein PR048_005408 [Dryococelus australis]
MPSNTQVDRGVCNNAQELVYCKMAAHNSGYTQVPREAHDVVLQFAHYTKVVGHPAGVMRRHFYWPGISRHADSMQQDAPWLSMEPFKTVALDLVGLYPRTVTGKRFVLVVTDLLSIWMEVYTISSTHTVHSKADIN